MDFSNFWWQVAASVGIGNSLRFRGSQSLSGHTGGSGTASVWIKRAKLGAAQTVMSGIAFDAGDKLNSSVALFRDPSAWMHVVVNANGTYVNGVSVASGSAISAGTIGASCELYLAEVYFIDGQALDPTDFGEYDANMVWTLKEYTGTYGANGFYLDFSNPGNIGADRSGNGNKFTPNGFELADQTSSNWDHMDDHPTQNYAVINPLYPGASTSNANLTTANDAGKPSILGIAGNVSVNGASVAWDGTEAGWNSTGNINFGQQPNGFDDFSTAELPDAPIVNGRTHFQAVTDTGANILTAAQTAFSNGFYWIKDRANNNQHQLVVNAANWTFNCPSPSYGNYIAPSGNSVAWCWDVSSPATTGVQLLNDTSTYTTNQIFNHALGVVPEMIIYLTGRTGQYHPVFHKDSPGWLVLGGELLNGNSAAITPASGMFPTVTSTQVGIYTEANTNAGDNIALILFRSVPGYSAFGSYTGNGNDDGAFIYTGFSVSMVLLKRTDTTGQWFLWDSTRQPVNPVKVYLQPNHPGPENSTEDIKVDFLSNGFKLRGSHNDNNANGGTYIYAAFAENPFGGSNVSPANAR